MRLKNLLLLFVLFCFVGCTPSTKTGPIPRLDTPGSIETSPFINYEAFIGSPNLSLPDGFETKGSFLISQHPIYEFELLLNNGVYSIWFSENKVVKDILVLPELAESEVIAAEYCQVEENVDPFIFAIAKLDQESFEKRFIENSRITQAWRAGPESGNIMEIPTTGIECSGEGGFDPNNVIYELGK